jgi:hypothetical protein
MASTLVTTMTTPANATGEGEGFLCRPAEMASPMCERKFTLLIGRNL